MLLVEMVRLEKDRNKKGGDTKKLAQRVQDAAIDAHREADETRRRERLREQGYRVD